MTQTPFPVKSRFADLFVDGFDGPLMAAWPSRVLRAEMPDADDLSAPLGLSPPSRRVIRDDPNDDDDSEPAAASKPPSKAPASKAPASKARDKPDSRAPKSKTRDTPDSGAPAAKARVKPDSQAPRTKTPDKPESQAPRTKTPDKPESQAPTSKTRDKPETQAPATKSPAAESPAAPEVPAVEAPDAADAETPSGDQQTHSPAADTQALDAMNEPKFDPGAENSAQNPVPPQDNDIIPAVDGAGGEPPQAPLTAADPDDADGEDQNQLSDEKNRPEPDSLTPPDPPAINNEQANPNQVENFVNRVGDYVRNLINGIFGGSDESEPDAPTMIPVVLPPPRNPTDTFRDGQMSQLELEEAAGRDPWTMCCAATFVYAVQTRYPGLSRESITEAFGNAADRPMSDDSGKCVEDNGYVGSIYQFSQAFSENLGLDEYVDVSGIYDTVEEARDAGAEMVKVEYSGSMGDTPIEHHTLLVGNTEIDPAPNGIDNMVDDGTKQVEGAMALDWYPLP
ncbi:MAG: hypothetical protein P1P77_04935 [Spirochaetaceae bacterium]|nr:hypothetical protein [Spirochaetaceae bacterium]